MAMDSKNFTYKNPYRAFYGIFIVFWIAMGALVCSLWYRYSDSQIETAKNQLCVINNYLLSIAPTDTVTINHTINSQQDSPDTNIDRIFLTIYDENGEVLYSNASAGRNSSILSFDNTSDSSQGTSSKPKSISTTHYDTVLQADCVITTTYSKANKRYIITECSINDTTSVREFLSTMSTKLILICLLLVVACVCMALLHKHISNIVRLRRYILQLSEEDNIKGEISLRPGKHDNVNNITEDLYTLYKNKIDIIKEHDREREKAILEEKNKLYSKRTLANNLNHEIKTPIGIILGYLDTLINHPDIDKKTQQNFLKKCLLNTQRLQNMVVNIAVISRLEDGSNNIALEETNIWKVANMAKEDLKFTLNEYNMTFKNEIEPDTFVKGNEMLLYNVFCNLIKNSCFYSLGTDIVVKRIAQNKEQITFSFYDNGIGVPKEALAKIFERFYRLEKDKNQKSGTGLGLPIVKESINLCGGKIQVNNRLEGGLEFSITLPRIEP